jgi:hypothetical protein
MRFRLARPISAAVTISTRAGPQRRGSTQCTEGALCGAATRTASIAPQFTAYDGCRAPEDPGHGPDTRTLQMQARNGQPLFGLKLLILSSFVHPNTLYETGGALQI